MDAVDAYKPSFIFGFPTFLLMLVNDPEVSRLDLSNLEIIGSGGAPVTPAVVNALMTIPSLKYVLNIYGLTECAPIISSFDFDQRDTLSDRPKISLGKLVPDSSAKFIHTDTGKGVVLERMERCATKKAFDKDGFFKTGDVISPTEIENIILDHPAIREVCVIGISDPNGGDKLPSYKHVRGGVYFVNELPKGKTGKVTRQLVEKLKLN
ncbi:unnamed protein product [Orchesella dallaii]|uniref:Uncharacterized protein n=1 Tax=Orchesella dallaii TaxID=48710 RepID=A0ABP1RQB9_9HEXA